MRALHRASASAPYSLSDAVSVCHARSAGSAPPQSAGCIADAAQADEQKRAPHDAWLVQRTAIELKGGKTHKHASQ